MSGVKNMRAPAGKGPVVAKEDGVMVHMVNEVYIYIPAELSAAGFELQIPGSVKIKDMDKVGVVRIN